MTFRGNDPQPPGQLGQPEQPEQPRRNEFDQPIGRAVDWAGAQPPRETTLRSAYCSVVPLAKTHSADLWEAYATDLGPAQFTYLVDEPVTSLAEMDQFVAGLIAKQDSFAWAILDANGLAVGTASYLRIAPTSGSIEVGAILFTAALRRTRAATEAMYLLASHAFEDLGYRRYEWKCDDLNAPSQAAALRLGFSYEGTFRNALVYKGRNRDTAWYAMTVEDWPQLKDRLATWLAPANFNPAGRQLTPLR